MLTEEEARRRWVKGEPRGASRVRGVPTAKNDYGGSGLQPGRPTPARSGRHLSVVRDSSLNIDNKGVADDH